MKRREFTNGLVATGLAAPMVLGAGPSFSEGVRLVGRIHVDIDGESYKPDDLLGQNGVVRGWRLDREFEITANGNAYREKAQRGTEISVVGYANDSLFFMFPEHRVLSPRLRVLDGGNTFRVPRRIKQRNESLRISATVFNRMPKVGMVYTDSKYTYLDLTPDF